MLKIEGLDRFSKDMEEAQRAFEQLNGELGKVNFDADDPASIEAAVAEVEHMVDERVGSYADNPIVGPMIDEIKESYRRAIIDRAAEVRLGRDG
jgi:hypothetical protein